MVLPFVSFLTLLEKLQLSFNLSSVMLYSSNRQPYAKTGTLRQQTVSWPIQLFGLIWLASVPRTVNSDASCTWQTLGCFQKLCPATFTGKYLNATASMTQALCQISCQGFTYAALFNGNECQCGNFYACNPSGYSHGEPIPDQSQCATPCAGKTSETCGGTSRYLVFKCSDVKIGASELPIVLDRTTFSSVCGLPEVNANATATLVSSRGSWIYADCFEASYVTSMKVTRPLLELRFSGYTPLMTLEYCLYECDYRDRQIAGIRNDECMCGDYFLACPKPSSRCNASCCGNAYQTCGSEDSVSVYIAVPTPKGVAQTPIYKTWINPANTPLTTDLSPVSVWNKPIAGCTWTLIGCYLRVSSHFHFTQKYVTSASMTISSCQSTCAGFAYAGITNGNVCICGNYFGGQSGPFVNDRPAPQTFGGCQTRCPGNAAETCGDSANVQAYQCYECKWTYVGCFEYEYTTASSAKVILTPGYAFASSGMRDEAVCQRDYLMGIMGFANGLTLCAAEFQVCPKPSTKCNRLCSDQNDTLCGANPPDSGSAISIYVCIQPTIRPVLAATVTTPPSITAPCLSPALAAKQPPGSASCSCSGDPHCYSFDRTTIHYQGTCRVLLVQLPVVYTPKELQLLPQNLTAVPQAVSVYMKAENWPGVNREFLGRRVSFVQWVEMEVYGMILRLWTNLGKATLMLNGKVTATPFIYPTDSTSNCTWLINVFAEGLDSLRLVAVERGLSITYRYGFVNLNLPNSYINKTRGLCGQWDGNPRNDLMTPNGTLVTDLNAFGDSWIMDSDQNCTKAPPAEMCPEALRAVAVSACAPLTARVGEFAKCLSAALIQRAAQLFESCVYDVCVTGRQDTACASAQVLADECAIELSNVTVNWRQLPGCDPTKTTTATTRLSTTTPCRSPVDVGKRSKGASSCFCAGDPHCYGFDGTVIHYQGTCRLLLVDASQANLTVLEAVSVFMKAENIPGVNNEFAGHRVSFVQWVEVSVFGKLFRLSTVGGKIMLQVDGNATALPYNFPANSLSCSWQINVALSGTDARLVTSFGLSVTYRWGYVDVLLPSEYLGNTKGLCGLWDKTPSNDLKTSNGTSTNDHNVFGDSWIVDTESNCTKGPPPTPCPPAHQTIATAYCSPLKSATAGSALLACLQNAVVQAKAKQLYESCIFDVCITGRQDTACSAMQVLSESCAVELPGTVFSWQQLPGCDPTKTTTSTTSLTTTTPCRSPIDVGKKIKASSSCFCLGDPHCHTFDGTLIHYQGTCRLLLVDAAQSNSTTLEPVTVYMKAETIAGLNREFVGHRVSFVQWVEVSVFGKLFRLSTAGSKVLLEVDGNATALPYSFPANPSACTWQINVAMVGSDAKLVTSFGLSVSYRWGFVDVQLPSEYMGTTKGLCGAWDKAPANDLKMPNGTSTNDHNIYGDSWIVDSDNSCTKGPASEPCPVARQAIAAAYCDPLKNRVAADGLFAACLPNTVLQAKAKQLYEGCVFDVCITGRQDTACSAMQVFADLCMAELQSPNVVPNWRQLTGCDPAKTTTFVTTTTAIKTSTTTRTSITTTKTTTTTTTTTTKSTTATSKTTTQTTPPKTATALGCRQCPSSAPRGVRPCFCVGDPHCTSFDGFTNHYQGTCKLILARPKANSTLRAQLTDFTVYMKSHSVPGEHFEFDGLPISTVEWLELSLYQQSIRLGGDGTILVNNNAFVASFQYATDGCNCQISVSKQGPDRVTLSTDLGLFLTIGNGYAEVILPDAFKNNVEGLCGSWDGNSENDLMTSSGQLTADVNVFGSSWVVDSNDGSNCTKAPPPILDQCVGDALRMAATACSPLIDPNSPFKQCLANPTLASFARQLNDGCIFDVCVAKRPDAACQALQALAERCNTEVGTTAVGAINWRNLSGCDACRNEKDCVAHSLCRDPYKNGSSYYECDCLPGYTGCGKIACVPISSLEPVSSTPRCKAGFSLTSVACYHNPPGSLIFLEQRSPSYAITSAMMTMDVCKSNCISLGYNIAGLERGESCFCGNCFSSAPRNATCDAFCPGDVSRTPQRCGGTYALSIYTCNGFSPKICS